MPFWAGVVLGAILLKPQSAYLVPVALLVAGRWRAVAGAVVAGGLLLAASVAVVGPSSAHEHLLVLQQAVENTDARRFTLYGLVGGVVADRLLAGAAVVVALSAAWMARRRGPELPIAAGVAGSLVATPYAYPYELVTLFLAGWLVLRATPPLAARWALLPIYVVVAFPQLLAIQAAVLGEVAFLLLVAVLAWRGPGGTPEALSGASALARSSAA